MLFCFSPLYLNLIFILFYFFKSVVYFSSVFLRFSFLLLSAQEQSPSNATSLAMMQEPQEVVEETVTIEEDPGTPTSHVSVVTSDDGTTRRTETKVRGKAAHTAWSQCKAGADADPKKTTSDNMIK